MGGPQPHRPGRAAHGHLGLVPGGLPGPVSLRTQGGAAGEQQGAQADPRLAPGLALTPKRNSLNMLHKNGLE